MIAASWDHPHITEQGVAVWWGGEHPGFANIQRPSLQIPALTNFLSESKDKILKKFFATFSLSLKNRENSSYLEEGLNELIYENQLNQSLYIESTQ